MNIIKVSQYPLPPDWTALIIGGCVITALTIYMKYFS
jgi:hypothetical protein